MDLQQHSKFFLSQKLTLLVNRYEYHAFDGDIQGEFLGFAEQKRFAFREHVTVWKSDAKNDVLFDVQAEKLLDIHGKFLVKDANGSTIGYVQKVFGSSLLRSTWNVCDANGALLFTASEKSLGVAIGRRVAQFIPLVEMFSGIIPFNFTFTHEGRTVGEHWRQWGSFTDQYVLTMGEELARCDRRLAMALGILLDALQDR